MSVVVFSGGTAFDSLVAPLARWTSRVTYVLPVTDNGGSTAEILRVLGGPAIGDVSTGSARVGSASGGRF